MRHKKSSIFPLFAVILVFINSIYFNNFTIYHIKQWQGIFFIVLSRLRDFYFLPSFETTSDSTYHCHCTPVVLLPQIYSHYTTSNWMHVEIHHKFNLKYFFDYTQYVRYSYRLIKCKVPPVDYFICHQFEEAWNWETSWYFFYYDCNSIFLLIWYLFMGKHRWWAHMRDPHRT